MKLDIALIVNCYERTWRGAVSPGRFEEIQIQNGRIFSERVLLVNNVNDPQLVAQAARSTLARGEIQRLLFVSDYIQQGLRVYGLNENILRSHPYFLDWGLVLPLATGCEWIVFWDPEVNLENAHDWISPSVTYMQEHPNVLCASPACE